MIKTITILGAGAMGYGIALNFSLAGYAINLADLKQEFLDAALTNIRG